MFTKRLSSRLPRSPLRLVKSSGRANQHAERGNRNGSSFRLVCYKELTLGTLLTQLVTWYLAVTRGLPAPYITGDIV